MFCNTIISLSCGIVLFTPGPNEISLPMSYDWVLGASTCNHDDADDCEVPAKNME